MICALGTSGTMGDATEAGAVDDQWRPAIIGSDGRPHLGQGANHALHRPARQGTVAAHDRLELVRGQNPGHQTHRRARVAGIERSGGCGQASGAAAVDLDDLAVAGALRRPSDRYPERPQAIEGREAVRPRKVALDVRAAVGERRQHGIAVRDGLVAGDPEAAGHTCGRLHQGRVGWRVRHFRTITLASGTHPPKQCKLGRGSPKTGTWKVPLPFRRGSGLEY